MKHNDDSLQKSPQTSIIDYIERISRKNEQKKHVSNVIKLHSSEGKKSLSSESRNTIQSALNYAESLKW